MTDPGLVQALDYILNHSDEASLDALIQAVQRRKKDLSAFHSMTGVPDPKRMAKEINDKLNAGIGGGIENVKDAVRDMAVRIIKQQAPELSDKQINELCKAWIPEKNKKVGKKGKDAPSELMLFMIEQFVSFSVGKMSRVEDSNLRKELGVWPDRYWKAFPPVIRQLITDYLKDRITEKEFNSGVKLALAV